MAHEQSSKKDTFVPFYLGKSEDVKVVAMDDDYLTIELTKRDDSKNVIARESFKFPRSIKLAVEMWGEEAVWNDILDSWKIRTRSKMASKKGSKAAVQSVVKSSIK